jgi:hypothetical protein
MVHFNLEKYLTNTFGICFTGKFIEPEMKLVYFKMKFLIFRTLIYEEDPIKIYCQNKFYNLFYTKALKTTIISPPWIQI